VGVLVLVTLYGTYWLRKRLAIATAEIEAERNADLLAKQQAFVAAGAPDPERANQPDLAEMSPSERREWEQQRQMDIMEMKKMNEGTRVSVQGR
jgi:sRNA-binding protein